MMVFGDGETAWHSRLGRNKDVLNWALGQVYPPYSQRPKEMRVAFAISLSWPDPQAFQLALGPGPLDYHCFEMTVDGWSLLMRAVEGIVHGIYENTINQRRPVNEQWCSVFRHALEADVDLHNHVGYYTTFLQHFLFDYHYHADIFSFKFKSVDHWNRRMTQAMKFFLDHLKVAGADILLYGQIERKLHEKESAFLDDDTWRLSSTYARHRGSLVNVSLCIKYGASIDEWKCWVDEAETYEYAEDVWNVTESPWERLPGAWVD